MNSYLQTSGPFRYLIPGHIPKGKELIYCPYWRLKGMLFSCSEGQTNHRIIDVSHRAINSEYFPASVGLRSQALKLRFATPDTPGRFLQPTLPSEQVSATINKRFSSFFPKPVIHQSYIGDTLSIIYAPHYVGDKIFDAVLNEPVSSDLPADFDISSFKGDRPDWSVRFLSTLCPYCGWDLKGHRNSLVLHCENCSSSWKSTRKAFARLNASFLPGQGEEIVYLPFWRLKTQITGIRLDTYADLIRAANLPKTVQKGMENVKFHFWALGFKVRPENFLKLSQIITLSQPAEKLTPGPPKGRKHPVTLPLKEAIESLKITLSEFLKPRRKMMAMLPDITITPKSFILVYLPFQEKQHELVQTDYALTLNKNLLSHARNL